jgi:hypothetical protein
MQRPLRPASELRLHRVVGRRGEAASEAEARDRRSRIERLTPRTTGVENDVTYWDATRSVLRTLRTP